MKKVYIAGFVATAVIASLTVGNALAAQEEQCINKSINQIQKSYKEKKLYKLMQDTCINITYGGTVIGRYTPSMLSEVTPTPVPTTTPTPTQTPTPVPTQVPTPTPATNNTDPLNVFDMSKWTLMLPLAKSDGDPQNDYPVDFTRPIDNIFFVRNGGVVFRTRVDGAHSKNSSYPRTELREMTNTSWGKAAWSNKSGTHTLEVRQAITHTPVVKPHVISAQIHDGSDDVIQVRLEGKELAIHYNDGSSKIVIDPNYVVGTIFDLKIVAANSKIDVYYNNTKYTVNKSGSGWYFKTGSYVNSNPSKGDAADAYGEVVIYSLNVTHN